jgi:hypothetical protein
MIRGDVKPRYDLIDPGFLRGLAEVLAYGAEKYGDRNWQKADEVAARDAANHAFEHLLKLVNGDTSEDHVHHLACNVMFLSHYLTRFPNLFQCGSK